MLGATHPRFYVGRIAAESRALTTSVEALLLSPSPPDALVKQLIFPSIYLEFRPGRTNDRHSSSLSARSPNDRSYRSQLCKAVRTPPRYDFNAIQPHLYKIPLVPFRMPNMLSSSITDSVHPAKAHSLMIAFTVTH